MLHTVHNYLFAQHHFHRTNPFIHMNSRLQYANTKLTWPYYMSYSYIIQPNYCEGTLRNFDHIKKCFMFLLLYAETNRPILFSIEHLQCVEGGATKCMRGQTFNLLYRDWMADKLDNREPSQEETRIFNHLLALQPHCSRPMPPCPHCLSGAWSRVFGILPRFRQLSSGLWVRVPDVGHSPTPLIVLTDPSIRDALFSKISIQDSLFSNIIFFLYISSIYSSLIVHSYIHHLLFISLSSFIQLRIRISSFLLPPCRSLLKKHYFD